MAKNNFSINLVSLYKTSLYKKWYNIEQELNGFDLNYTNYEDRRKLLDIFNSCESICAFCRDVDYSSECRNCRVSNAICCCINRKTDDHVIIGGMMGEIYYLHEQFENGKNMEETKKELATIVNNIIMEMENIVKLNGGIFDGKM